MTGSLVSLRRIGAGLLLLAILYTILWSVEAGRMRDRVEGFLGTAAGHAITIGGYQLSIGGFPLWLEADFNTLSIDGLPYAETLRLDAPALVVRARPWRPGAWQFAAPGGFTLVDRQANGLTVKAARARGRAGLNTGEPAGLELALESYDLSLIHGSTAATAGHGFLQVIVPDQQPEDRTGPSLSFALAIDGAQLPQGLDLPDRVVSHAGIAGVVEGLMPPPPLAPALTAWRAAGGSIELRDLALHWGNVELSGDGTVTLDANLQPAVALSGRIRGWEGLIADFVQAGLLTPEIAKYYQLGLGLLTRTADDGKSELKAPITVQNQELSLGPAKIAKLPAIDWQ
jgi:hypothetical protein